MKSSEQKALAKQLDVCAARAYRINKAPATGKQCWFLASLLLKASQDIDVFYTNTSLVLTKREASHQIDSLLNA